jgi:hypothetical protein
MPDYMLSVQVFQLNPQTLIGRSFARLTNAGNQKSNQKMKKILII